MQYGKRDFKASFMLPVEPPVTHLAVVDLGGTKPTRIEPSAHHAAYYGSHPCGVKGCPLALGQPEKT